MGYEKTADLTGKTADLINAAKDFNFKERFGGIPKSIMKFKKSKVLMDLIDGDNSEIGKIEGDAIAKGGGYAKTLRSSIYNPDQAEFILDYYTNKNDLILDPFMGRATRPLIALSLDRKYIGFDTSSKTIELNRELIQKKLSNSVLNATLVHGDGTKMEKLKEHSSIIDAIFTCPPYYNVEKYSGEDGDISYLKYDEFDIKMDECVSNCSRLIKKSSYKDNVFHPIIFTVGTVRKGDDGLIDMDYLFQTLAKKHGLTLHDKMLTENTTPGAGFTFRRNFCYKYVTKNYETTLVFLKY